MGKKVELRTLKPGTRFNQNGTEGILLDVSINAEVMVYSIPDSHHFNTNESYYKGKHTWSAGTLVEEQ